MRVIFAGKLEIGEASWIGHEVLFTGGGESLIKLGKYCDIAPRVSFVAGTHEIDPDGKRVAGKPISESILIGGGVWVGSCATILGNTVLGDHCVVAAGAVVRGTFPQKCLIAGVPAKIIRRI